MYAKQFYVKIYVFRNSPIGFPQFLAPLERKFVTETFQNRPIWSHWLFFIIFGAANVYIFVVLSLLFSKAINKQLGYVWSVFVGLLVEQLVPKSTLQIQSEAICQMYSEGK